MLKSTAIRLSNNLSLLSAIGKVAHDALNVSGHGTTYTIPSKDADYQAIRRFGVDHNLFKIQPKRSIGDVMDNMGVPDHEIMAMVKTVSAMQSRPLKDLYGFVKRFLLDPGCTKIAHLFIEHTLSKKQERCQPSFLTNYFCIEEGCEWSVWCQLKDAYKRFLSLKKHYDKEHGDKHEWCSRQCVFVE